MDKKKKALNLIIEQGILPLYFHPNADVSAQILKTMYRAGIRVIEYTNRGDTAWENFIQLRKVADKELPGLLLGAGTIKDKIAATEFVNEGADFVVCPGVIKEVIKLFPGNLLTPSYIRAVKEIFPELLFMPTGGLELSEEGLNAWFAAGASSVGIGSSLINKNLIEAGDFVSIEISVKNGLEMVKKIKKDRL